MNSILLENGTDSLLLENGDDELLREDGEDDAVTTVFQLEHRFLRPLDT